MDSRFTTQISAWIPSTNNYNPRRFPRNPPDFARWDGSLLHRNSENGEALSLAQKYGQIWYQHSNCSNFAGQNSDNIVKHIVRSKALKEISSLNHVTIFTRSKLFEKIVKIMIAVEKMWLIRLRQLRLELRRLWLFPTIVIGVATIVVDYNNYEH